VGWGKSLVGGNGKFTRSGKLPPSPPLRELMRVKRYARYVLVTEVPKRKLGGREIRRMGS
jgi:hypothetical protein